MVPLRLAVAWRPVPARVGEEHTVTRLLRDRGFAVIQTQDGHLDLDALEVVLVLENARWFPTIVHDLASRARRRPRLVVWHWEPLPLPRSAGVPPSRLHWKELAKIALRDPRATDVYSNLAGLRRLGDLALPDLLLVSSRAWQQSLAEEGLASEFLPYGFEDAEEPPARGSRHIEALFLGALDVPRRRRIIRRLRRSGVALTALGSWHSPDLWGRSRARLIHRADAFLNLQRSPGQMSTDRLLLGMVGKALVVSEPIYRPEPFVPGEHYVEAEVDEMPDVLAHYRRNRDERDQIVDRAHRFVTGKLSMGGSLDHLDPLLRGLVSTGGA